MLSDELEKLAALRDRGVLSESEFSAAKQGLLHGAGAPGSAGGAAAPVAALNRLRRNLTGDRWLGGVCGGLARLSGLESWIWRLLFVLMALFGGAGLLAYLLLWILVPVQAE
jgi:phage shock protein PspC (stress-responsive transcriptional regulator)